MHTTVREADGFTWIDNFINLSNIRGVNVAQKLARRKRLLAEARAEGKTYVDLRGKWREIRKDFD